MLILGYLKETRQLTPEWQMKLEQAISQGYQRLLTFESKGGGFDWYGRSPANTILTAYGVLEFCDMAKVHPVDGKVIDRAVQLLLQRQKPDGSWEGDAHWARIDPVAVTAYVAWALRQAGVPNRAAEEFLRSRRTSDPYVLALIANVVPGFESELEKMGQPDRGAKRWPAKSEGLFHSQGTTAMIESTALAAMALRSSDALVALARDKAPDGGWGSTQATILALKAILQTQTQKPPARPVRIAVLANGREAGTLEVTAENFDVLQSLDVTPYVGKGANRIELVPDAEFEAGVQFAGRYYRPWSRETPSSLFDLDVQYAKTELNRGDKLEATARLTYRGEGTFMVIVDLGIPPGFDVDAAPFERLVQDGTIDKFTIAGRQVSLYFGRVTKGQEVRFGFTLRPRFPLRAGVPFSTVYEYYAPERRAAAKPVTVIVK